VSKDWEQYEKQIFKEFKNKYPDQDISYNQKITGQYSQVSRQIDILIKARIGDSTQIGVFDCKKFNSKINVKSIDSMIGYMDDLNVNYGGLITTKGYSKAAYNRASARGIKLEIIDFESPKQIVEHFIPSLDFSKVENSMYIPLIF